MNSALFIEWLDEFNEHIKASDADRQVLLLIDGAGCHAGSVDHLMSNVKVWKLPPNCTAIMQPCDQGIIRSVKIWYRSVICKRLLDSIEYGYSHAPPTVPEAVRLLRKAWQFVHHTTIMRCWRHSAVIERSRYDDLLPKKKTCTALVDSKQVMKQAHTTFTRPAMYCCSQKV